MKIRLNIDDELLAESMELSGISNKTKIIERKGAPRLNVISKALTG